MSADRLPAMLNQEGTFDRFIQASFPWMALERPALDKYLPREFLTSQIQAFDAGCGSGRIPKYLASRGVEKSGITGMDKDPIFIAIARQEMPQMHFVVGDISEKIDLGKRFNLVTAHQVLNILSLDQLRRALINFYEILEPGGRLLYIVPHPIRKVAGNLGRYFVREETPDKTPWGGTIPYVQKTVGDYVNSTIEVGFRLAALGEPELHLADELTNPRQYRRHMTYPSRLVIVATK